MDGRNPRTSKDDSPETTDNQWFQPWLSKWCNITLLGQPPRVPWLSMWRNSLVIPNGCYISFVPQWFPPWFSLWCNITSLGRLLLIAPIPPCSHRDPFDPSNSSRRQLHSAQGQHGMPLFGAPTCRLRARSLPEAEMGRCWSTRKRRWVGAPLKLLGT